MSKVVAITGASAGVGRAAAEEFARRGYSIGLIARGEERLHQAASELQRLDVKTCVAPADVADAAALGAAAEKIEAELGPIDVWVNNATATILAPLQDITPDEFRRATEVTYLGQVYGTLIALRHMERHGGRGSIVNVGSALAYRSVPLQAPYCGAKHAIVGFTDSLRSELIHNRSRIKLCVVHLPALNTPQFDWSLNKMPRAMRPMAPVYQPDVAARAIAFAARHRRREIWVGWPTVKAILANKFAPGLSDFILAKIAYRGQMTQQPNTPNAPSNLFEPVLGAQAAYGRFDAEAIPQSWEMVTSRHRIMLEIGLAATGFCLINSWLKRKFRRG